MPEGVHVLHFGSRSERLLTFGPDRDIGIAPEASLFHIPGADLQILKDGSKPSQIIARFLGGPDIGLAHDLKQRNACSIEVDVTERSGLRSLSVLQLPCIL